MKLRNFLGRMLPAWLVLGMAAAAAAASATGPADEGAWRLLPQAQVHAEGVYLNELVDSRSAVLPHVRLAAAPVVGQATVLTRAQITELLRQTMPELVSTNWTGALQIRITRRTRRLEETEAKQLLTAALQEGFVKERGTLELRLTRPWVSAAIADEPFTVHILDLPNAGVTPNFVVRFELRSASGLLGNWQVPVQAKIWRDVWVAGSPLPRGQLLKHADVVQERRDILTVRDALPTLDREDPSLELAENLLAGAPLTARSLRVRPIVQRGRVVEALIQQGALTISVKAELLEDGVRGQMVRARNLKSKREFRGKVHNEETILVAL